MLQRVRIQARGTERAILAQDLLHIAPEELRTPVVRHAVVRLDVVEPGQPGTRLPRRRACQNTVAPQPVHEELSAVDAGRVPHPPESGVRVDQGSVRVLPQVVIALRLEALAVRRRRTLKHVHASLVHPALVVARVVRDVPTHRERHGPRIHAPSEPEAPELAKVPGRRLAVRAPHERWADIQHVVLVPITSSLAAQTEGGGGLDSLGVAKPITIRGEPRPQAS